MSPSEKLVELSQLIVADQACSGLAEQATQLVMGSGNIEADIVFVGEAPGKKEDELGVPFVGSAGKFLDKMLESAGMARGNVYITNIVKYRPPNNRDPSKSEKAAFLPYLLREIEIIQPKVIITLGRHSMEYFLPGAIIGDVHGQIQQVVVQGKQFTIAPLYHPAAALYNGSLRQTLFDDFTAVAAAINQL